MNHYENQMRAAKAIRTAIKTALNNGNVINIAKLKLEITENHPVSVRFVTQQIMTYIESDPRIVEEDGELWFKQDSIKE